MQQITSVATLMLVLCLVAFVFSGCTRTDAPPTEVKANLQSPSTVAAQPPPDIAQATPQVDEIVPVAPAGAVIDTAQLPDTLYGNTTDMSVPQFYDATAPAVVTASNTGSAIVIVSEASLHALPDAKSKAVMQVAKDTTVRLNDQRRGAWFYCVSEKGVSGWIHGNNIKLLAAKAKSVSGAQSDSKKPDEAKATSMKISNAADAAIADEDKANDADNPSGVRRTLPPAPAKNTPIPKLPAKP